MVYPSRRPTRVVAGYPIRLPALDIHTIGAGGGSLARLDAGGALVVGPESAGAVPGPACYGRGGTQPTVTDADLVAGPHPRRAPRSRASAVSTRTRRDAALERAGVTADGVLAVVDAAMEEAVRAVTVAQGVDPRELALVAFGGAGPLHACAIAGALGMRAVVVPPRAGVLSAVGLLCSPVQRELVRSWADPADHEGARRALEALAAETVALVGGDAGDAGRVAVEVAFDCRYAGQSHELRVPDVDDVPRRARTAQRVRARVGARSKWSRSGRARRRPAPLRVDELPPVDAARCARARRSSPRPTARCGCPKGGKRPPARSARSCSSDRLPVGDA